MFAFFLVLALVACSVSAFQLKSSPTRVSSLKMGLIDQSLSLAASDWGLFASPTATYRGELIDTSIKVVERVATKSADYGKHPH
jgi:hypothetical protein